MNIKRRFEDKFIPETNTGCWLWYGATTHQGYGRFNINKKNEHAHRVSYRLYIGEIPDALCVLHRCDTPYCVNPYHLFLGTRRDNNLDRDTKGRTADTCGIKNGRAKLSDEQVLKIKNDNRKGTVIAKEYGVNPSTVCKIRKGRTWQR